MPNYDDLPPAQRKVLEEVLANAENDRTLPPTFEELATKLGLKSKANIRRQIEALESGGFFTRTRRGPRVVARSIKPTQKAWEWWVSQGHDLPSYMQGTNVSLSTRTKEETTKAEDDFRVHIYSMGEVAAGKPTLATEDSSDHVSLGDLFRGTELFFLKVTGDSMSGDGILIGDYVVVDFDSRGRCEDGDMVVVSVNGEATVKRMWRDGNSFHLESSNPTYEPIIVEESEESLLLGKVVGVVRDHIKKGYHRRD